MSSTELRRRSTEDEQYFDAVLWSRAIEGDALPCANLGPKLGVSVMLLIAFLTAGFAFTTPASSATAPNARFADIALASVVRDPPKDVWDKLEAASGIVAGVLVAAIGALATYLYNRRQHEAAATEAVHQRLAEDARAERELAVLRVQTIQSFFPHLKSGDDRDREAALLAIDALGDHALASQLAISYGGKAAVAALSRIATTATDETAAGANASLATVLDALRGSVVQIIGQSSRATGFIVAPNGVIATAHFAVEIDEDVRVRFANNKEQAGVVVYRGARDLDIALLQIESERLPSLRISKVPAAIGEEVVTLGFGGSGGNGVTAGVVVDVLPPDGASVGEVHARIRTEPGFAGAPLVNRNGEVVAVHGGSRPNPDGTKTAFAVPGSAVADALADAGIEL